MRDNLRRRPLLTAALAAVLALAVGLAAGVTLGRPSTPGDDSAEAGFARDMIRHHAQAVEMGMAIYVSGSSEYVRGLGYDMALTQQAQIGTMSTWLSDWDLLPTSTEPPMGWMDGETTITDGLMPGMATDAQMAELHAATGEAADILFAQLMITHHTAGVHMAEAVLDRTDDPRVTKLAQAIKDGQQSEINALRKLLTDLGATES